MHFPLLLTKQMKTHLAKIFLRCHFFFFLETFVSGPPICQFYWLYPSLTISILFHQAFTLATFALIIEVLGLPRHVILADNL